ncbi:MAG: hypothetical protein V1827_03025 [Candidatus Micrarchaeota archaeon]
MDDEEVIPMMAPQQQIPQVIQFSALAMTAEFIMIFGVIFILLGAGQFVTDLLKVKGSGEILVGLLLCGGAVALLMFSKRQMPKAMPRVPKPPQVAPPAAKLGKKDESASYR